MSFEEKFVSGKRVYEGVIVDVRVDEVTLSDGSPARREVVEHPGGVAVMAIDSEDRVIMVRQYRYPLERETWELPAGKLDPGEDPESCAIRELEEETGIHPGRIRSIGQSYSSPGILSEKIHLYIAQDLQEGEAHPDPGELVKTERVPLTTLLSWIAENKLCDGKTVQGILKGSMLLDKNLGQ